MDTTRGTSTGRDPVVVVTGGGTAGHVLPALAILESLEEASWSRDALHYVGCRRGLERDLLPATGYTHTLLAVRGLARGVSPRALVGSLWALVGQLVALRAAIRLLRERRAAAVVAVGGYASVPVSFAAIRLGIPLVVCSYDSRPGRATALLARRARASCVTHLPSSLPRARPTGAPIRRAIRLVDRGRDRDRARLALGMPTDRPLVVVVGGSLGSPALNASVDVLIARLVPEVAICALEGARHRSVDESASDAAGVTVVRRVATHDPIADVYAAADVLVCRAGASTLAEVSVTGVPAVVVPWPDALDDHQRANAAALCEAGAVVVVEEGPDFAQRLADEVSGLLADPVRRSGLSHAALRYGERHREGGIAAVIREIVLPPAEHADRQG